MKNLFLSLVIATIAFTSCDKVSGPYGGGGTFNPGDTNLVRKVLVEDFTGHTCGNCPDAARALEPLKTTYGDNLIILSVHAGFFAKPSPPDYPADFRTTVGDELNTSFGFIAYPNGMVNRAEVNGSKIISYDSWGTEVAKNVALEPDAKISISSTYTTANRNLDISVTTEFVKSTTGNYKMCAYLVEDNIISDQKDYSLSPNDHVTNYNHRHMLRGSFNGTWGDAINNALNNPQQLDYSITVDPSFDENNISIIAFIYDDSSSEIIQVEEHHITP